MRVAVRGGGRERTGQARLDLGRRQCLGKSKIGLERVGWRLWIDRRALIQVAPELVPEVATLRGDRGQGGGGIVAAGDLGRGFVRIMLVGARQNKRVSAEVSAIPAQEGRQQEHSDAALPDEFVRDAAP